MPLQTSPIRSIPALFDIVTFTYFSQSTVQKILPLRSALPMTIDGCGSKLKPFSTPPPPYLLHKC